MVNYNELSHVLIMEPYPQGYEWRDERTNLVITHTGGMRYDGENLANSFLKLNGKDSKVDISGFLWNYNKNVLYPTITVAPKIIDDIDLPNVVWLRASTMIHSVDVAIVSQLVASPTAAYHTLKIINDGTFYHSTNSQTPSDAVVINGGRADIENNYNFFGGINLAGGNDRFVNSGKLMGRLLMGAGDDYLLNTGTGILESGYDYDLGDGNDTYISEGTARKTINLGAGNDTFIAGPQVDSVNAGTGIDTVSYARSNAAVNVDLVNGARGSWGFSSGDGIGGFEKYILSNFDDKILLLAENATIDGGLGADTMAGGDGSDVYLVDNAGDVIVEKVAGGSQDSLIASASYVLGAGVVLESMTAAAGTAPIALTGNELNQTIFGNAGNNTLSGGGGADTMTGGAGNDTYIVDSVDDVIVETADGGTDTVIVVGDIAWSPPQNVEVYPGSPPLNNGGNSGGGGGPGTGTGTPLVGGAGAGQILVAPAAGGTLVGGSKNDVLIGGKGRDRLDGAAGDDKIFGRLNKDQLVGGTGNDVFVFDTKLNKKRNVDKIADFSVPDDSIWLENKIFKKVGKGSDAKPGALNKKFFTIGTKAKDANDFIVYSKAKGTLYYDADGSGSKAAIAFATVKSKLKLTAGDFFVI